MPIELWPDSDRVRWERALVQADILDDDGARARHNPVSNLKAAKGYGRWLTYLALQEEPTAALPAPLRITPERVRRYVEHLRSLDNSSATILARLQELGEVARVIHPEHSWSFIRVIARKVRAQHRPVRSKRHLRLSDELLALGTDLIEHAEGLRALEASITARDGLVIALLTLVPLRRRNLADLRVGESLIRQASQWVIYFTEDDTKTHTVFETTVPHALTAALDRYVDRHRPYLMRRTGRWKKPAGAALWISKDGSPMTQIALYD